ncbi:MAG: DUF2520 domain-containing protein [Coxiellaceae bacterium]|nr:DUF2520 domain-containing protein [Coxiellaceae bacterium]
MAIQTINIIGAGKLGLHVAYVLKHQKNIIIQAVCNRSLASGQRVVERLGVGHAVAEIADLPSADMTLIAVPDDTINTVADELALSDNLQMHSVIVHCSGSLSSQVLNAARVKNCDLVSMHPMKSFASTGLNRDGFNGVFCALEGDSLAVQQIKLLFQGISVRWLAIDSEKKMAYHAAGVFASNYLVSIAHSACQCLEQAGVEQQLALEVVTELMQGTIANIQQNACLRSSLTGPVQRGDLMTIQQHMQHLSHSEQQKLYAELGRNIIDLTCHNEDLKSQLDAILQESTS